MKVTQNEGVKSRNTEMEEASKGEFETDAAKKTARAGEHLHVELKASSDRLCAWRKPRPTLAK